METALKKERLTTMSIHLKYFGMIADIMGQTEEQYSTNAKTVGELKALLSQSEKQLLNITYAVAVNQQLVVDSCRIEEGYEIALLPPFSGG